MKVRLVACWCLPVAVDDWVVVDVRTKLTEDLKAAMKVRVHPDTPHECETPETYVLGQRRDYGDHNPCEHPCFVTPTISSERQFSPP